VSFELCSELLIYFLILYQKIRVNYAMKYSISCYRLLLFLLWKIQCDMFLHYIILQCFPNHINQVLFKGNVGHLEKLPA
jgi:hypothetical protein